MFISIKVGRIKVPVYNLIFFFYFGVQNIVRPSRCEHFPNCHGYFFRRCSRYEPRALEIMKKRRENISNV